MRPSSPFFAPEQQPSFVARAREFFRTLSPGDRLIAGILSVITLATIFAGLIALQRSFLVEIPARGGSLIEGVVGTPRFINPLLALSDADRDLTTLTHAGLMGIDGDGTLIPVLAEGYTVSEDGLQYTFTLREHAQFSNGTPVTASDVVFTVEKAQDPALRSPEFANWANIRAEALDARTVQFTLPRPYAPFLVDTTLGILPADMWRNIPVESFAFSPLMTEPIGAGPFTVSRIVRAKDGTITAYELRAAPHYVLGRPYLDRITIKFYSDAQKLSDAYARGQIESAYGLPVADARRAPYSRVFGAFFNSDENPVFARPEVRQALSLAVDRERIATDLLGGFATPLTGPLPVGSGIEPFALPEGDRLTLAQEALHDGGWARDAETGMWRNERQSLALPAVTIRTSHVPELRAIAAELEADWEALGIQTTVEVFEPGDLTASVIRPRAYEILLFGMVIGRDRDLFAFWSSGERSDPGLNIAAYANREVDILLERIRENQNNEEAMADLTRVAHLIASEYPAAFTHTPEFLYAIPTNVRGVVLPQITAPADRFATVSSWYKHTEHVWPLFQQ